MNDDCDDDDCDNDDCDDDDDDVDVDVAVVDDDDDCDKRCGHDLQFAASMIQCFRHSVVKSFSNKLAK